METTRIIIEFDSKNFSPLDVINILDKSMKQNLEEGNISDYSLKTETIDEDTLKAVSVETVLVARSESEEVPAESKTQGEPKR
jgi:hypothetical protein